MEEARRRGDGARRKTRGRAVAGSTRATRDGAMTRRATASTRHERAVEVAAERPRAADAFSEEEEARAGRLSAERLSTELPLGGAPSRRSASRRSASRRSAPRRSASRRSAPRRSASLRTPRRLTRRRSRSRDESFGARVADFRATTRSRPGIDTRRATEIFGDERARRRRFAEPTREGDLEAKLAAAEAGTATRRASRVDAHANRDRDRRTPATANPLFDANPASPSRASFAFDAHTPPRSSVRGRRVSVRSFFASAAPSEWRRRVAELESHAAMESELREMLSREKAMALADVAEWDARGGV